MRSATTFLQGGAWRVRRLSSSPAFWAMAVLPPVKVGAGERTQSRIVK